MELFKASQQWSSRPADQKFHTIEEAYTQSKAYADSAQEKTDVDPSTLRVENFDGEVKLIGRGNIPARLSHWSFGQLAQRAGAPAGYLRELPATLAAQNINYGLKTRYPENTEEKVNLLTHVNGDMLVRAFTSEKYTRIWNHSLLKRMLGFKSAGWRTPVPFENNTLAWNGCNLCKGGVTPAVDHDGKRMHFAHMAKGQEWVACANQPEPTIYVSDHDMFVFLTNPNIRVKEPGNPAGLQRGFFVENSEVGAAKLRITTFFYRDMCCNHIVWGASDVVELAMRHVGRIDTRMEQFMDRLEVSITKLSNESVSDIEAKIASAKNKIIDTDREKVIDAIFKNLKGDITRTALVESQKLAVEHLDTDGDPNSVWGMAQGITRHSQTQPFADVRVKMDRAAGRLIDTAF
jgi:hypothetical protein